MRSQNKRKKYLRTMGLAISAVILTSAVYWFLLRDDSPTNQTPPTDESSVNYAPPTDEEKQQADEVKENLADKDDTGATNDNNAGNGSKKTVYPTISNWGNDNEGTFFEVNGYVDGIIEKGGICTLTLTKSGKTVTQTKQALENAQNTNCGLIQISASKLSAGTWQVTLAYSSAKASGVSETIPVKVE